MDETWTLAELVEEAANRLAALPPPKNGQIRAVPDERTLRYYAAIGLLDRPVAMRGRTALYGRRHLAQLVAIKRLQGAEHSLAEIRKIWPTLDDFTLARMTGVVMGKAKRARQEFWKLDPIAGITDGAAAPPGVDGGDVEPARADAKTSVPAPAAQHEPHPLHDPVELRLEIAEGAVVVVAVAETSSITLAPADVRALRAAAAPLVTELARRGLVARDPGKLEGP